MPMFQLPAGREDHREFVIGRLGRRNDAGRHQHGAAVLRREAVAKDDFVTRLVRSIDRIGDHAFAFQPVPGDVVE